MEQARTETIHLLVDYRGHFCSSVRSRGASMELPLLERHFASRGYRLAVRGFKDVDFRRDDFRDEYVLYQSAEDRDLRYKDYIEDVLLGLTLQGAVLIPGFTRFRAHHNKVFMEILRDLSPDGRIRNLRAYGYGTLEEYLADAGRRGGGTWVVKPSAGALSAGVRKVGEGGGSAAVRKISRSIHPLDFLKDVVNRLIRDDYVPKSCHRRKFLAQPFIPGLSGDYKVLVFGERYYVLHREIRPNDFRASGSGRFSYREELPPGLLGFAEEAFAGFDVPFASLDIGFDGAEFYLIEFQFVSFGTYTLEKADAFFVREGEAWRRVPGASVLEEEFARSVAEHLARRAGGKGECPVS